MVESTIDAGKLAGIIALIAFFPYNYAVIWKGARPNRATWFVWMIMGFLLGGSYWASGANHTIWVPISYAIGPLITFILSLKYGEGGLTKFDRGCLKSAAVGLLFWIFFQNPIVAMIVFLGIDAAGCLPTIRKSYYEPWGEDRIAWALFVIGNTVNLFAVESWELSNAAIWLYPIWMVIGSGIIAALVLLPREISGAVS